MIVDEITSGFRICDSGSYIKYGYDPDIAVYGKALGNGFAISAVVGKKQTMEAGIKSFISSTMYRKSWIYGCNRNAKKNEKSNYTNTL